MNNYEKVLEKYIKLKKEELDYINNISKISNERKLTEYERIKIYIKLREYEKTIKDVSSDFVEEIRKLKKRNLEDVIVEFDIDKDFLSSINFYNDQSKEYYFGNLGINIKEHKFQLTIKKLVHDARRYEEIDQELIQNGSHLLDVPIYIFEGFYDSSEDCYGPAFGYPFGYIKAVYEELFPQYSANDLEKYIKKEEMEEFEKDKIIINAGKYVEYKEVKDIFKKELLNKNNKSINDCVVNTRKKLEKLNYERSPEYREKVLLDRINKLYKKVKGESIKEEVLYSDEFVNVLKQTYKLQNNEIKEQEKIVKNEEKDTILIIPITQDNEYIINIDKFDNKVSLKFPYDYIGEDEDIEEATNKILKEQTGYITDIIYNLEEVYTSSGKQIHIVVANNCIKEKGNNELMNYGLFAKKELRYLINSNMMNNSINKLAYYSLLNNTEDNNIIYSNEGNAYRKIYKTVKDKKQIAL